MNISTYRIADFLCKIMMVPSEKNHLGFLPSFVPFRVKDEEDGELLFTLRVDDSLRPFGEGTCERIRTFENENGDIVVDEHHDGHYQFVIKNMLGKSCCLLQADKNFTSCQCALKGNPNMRTYGLNSALMMTFAFAACRRNTLLIHASTVRKDGIAYAFTAKSGTGKSTHVAQWMKALTGCDIVNDDNPVVRLMPQPILFGSPWSGKTPCYRNIRVSLGAVVKVNRAEENRVEPSETVDSFITLLTACATMKWDSEIYRAICATVKSFVEHIPMYNLYCLPNEQSALVCFNALRPHTN